MKRVEILIVKEVETAAEATALINSVDAAYGVINAGFRTVEGIIAPAPAQTPALAKKKAAPAEHKSAPVEQTAPEEKTYTYEDLQGMTSQIGTLGAKKAVEFSKKFLAEVLKTYAKVEKLSALKGASPEIIHAVAKEFVTRFEKEGGKLNG